MPGTSPLFLAVNAGDVEAVKRLIAGLHVDDGCTDMMADNGHTGHTPLDRAAYNGRVEGQIFTQRGCRHQQACMDRGYATALGFVEAQYE